MPFPTIRHIDDVLPHVQHKPEIKVKEAEGLLIVCYMVAGLDTFDSAVARECRGITFNASSGAIVSRPLHKFFNIGERDDTQPHILPLDRLARVTDKLDGSLIHTVIAADGTVRLKSKKSLDAPQVKAATQFVKERQAYVDLLEYASQDDLTAIFEWCAPDNQIVVAHEAPSLRLLAVRENETGRYHDVDSYASRVPKVAMRAPRTLEGWLAYAETTKGEEGVVLQFDDGEMVKLKTAWYLALHHAFTALRVRDVGRMVLDETIDDLYSTLSREGVDVSPVRAIHRRVTERLRDVEVEVALLASASVREHGLDMKAIAQRHVGHPLFALLMQQVRGKEPGFKKFVAGEVDAYPLTAVSLGSSINAEAAE